MSENKISYRFKLYCFFLKHTPSFFKELKKIYDLYLWYKLKKSEPPSPHFIKQSILLRHNIKNSTWIETGTYLGHTTKLLSENSNFVHTIEPSKKCLMLSRYSLRNKKNIFFYEGTSEKFLEKIISNIKEQNICIWLDGHFSDGITFKGAIDTPIKTELKIIEKYLHKFGKLTIFIDDIRCSGSVSGGYPELNFYVLWAKNNDLNWHIEQDIMIIKSKLLEPYP